VDGIFRFDSEDESCVLMDYCIHDCRDLGRNAVDRYLARAGLDEEERSTLQAMKMARFSLFRTTGVVRGIGVNALDLFRTESVFIVDINLGTSAGECLIPACRLVPFGDHFATTGAALPVDRESLGTVRAALEAWGGADISERIARFSPGQQAEFTAIVLRTCLAGGASHHVRYEM